MNVAILCKIFFVLPVKYLLTPNREIRAKLLFYNSGLVGWFTWYGIAKDFKFEDVNILLV